MIKISDLIFKLCLLCKFIIIECDDNGYFIDF